MQVPYSDVKLFTSFKLTLNININLLFFTIVESFFMNASLHFANLALIS